MKQSELELLMNEHLLEAVWELIDENNFSMDPVPHMREFRFHDERRWRFDFAYPGLKVAVECEGGIWKQGRHNRGQGFLNDCIKYNTAAELGWIVLRYPMELIESGEAKEQIKRILVRKWNEWLMEE